MELYNYSQGGTLENLKYENGLEKSQIDQLMLKLKEKEALNEELEVEIAEITETINLLYKLNKDLEDKLAELEKDTKTKK